MSLEDDKLIYETYRIMNEADPAAPAAAPLQAYSPGTTFTYNGQVYTIATGHIPNPATDSLQVNDQTGALVIFAKTDLDAIAAATAAGTPTVTGITAAAKEGEAGTGEGAIGDGDPKADQAAWSQGAQAGIMGGPLSSDKDSVLHGVQVPGAAAGVRGKDWLTRGVLQGASNIVGKMGKKAPERGNSAIMSTPSTR